jgi:hypothetical protein
MQLSMPPATTPPEGGTQTCGGYRKRLFGPIWLVLALFISARLMMLMIWPAENLSLYGDYDYHFRVAALSKAGHLPFIHYWSGPLPVFSFLSLALYQLSGGEFKNYVLLLNLVLLAFEAASLYLLYRLAADACGKDRALQLGWIYAVLYVPVFIWLSTFEAMTAFFMLAALWALQRRRSGWAGFFIGLGTMTKLVPFVLLAVVWRERGWRAALVSGLIALLVCLAIVAPLFVLSPNYTLASLRAQASKSSWQTVWALIDGNVANTGNFGPIADQYNLAKASTQLYNPSRLPAWLTLLPFAALGLFVFTRPVRRARQDALIFSALLITLFFLWSKGWSPQWQMFYIPLLLLALPAPRAAMFIVVLGFVNILEWPVILSRGLTQLLPLTIAIRTLIFALLGWELYKQLSTQVTEEAHG